MGGKSLNIVKDKIEQLKAILPEAVAEGKIDWEKLRLTLGDTERLLYLIAYSNLNSNNCFWRRG